MAQDGFSIFDTLKSSPTSLAEAVTAPFSGTLPSKIVKDQPKPEPTVAVRSFDSLPSGQLDPRSENFPYAVPVFTPGAGDQSLGTLKYDTEGFGVDISEPGKPFLSSEPALTDDPSKITTKYSESFAGMQTPIERTRPIQRGASDKVTPILSISDVPEIADNLLSFDVVIGSDGKEYSLEDYAGDDIEQRKELVNQVMGVSVGVKFTPLGGKATDQRTDLFPIDYLKATVYDENYERVLKDIDDQLVGIPFAGDKAQYQYMINEGMDEDTNRAIFAKRLDEFLINAGETNERNRAGIILHHVNLPQFGGIGYGDKSKLVGITNEVLRFAVSAPAYIFGEAYQAIVGDLKVGNYNLSDSVDRQAWVNSFIPKMPNLIQDRYTQIGLDVSYPVAERLARRFSGPATTGLAIAAEVKGGTAPATARKIAAGAKEMKMFKEYSAKYEKDFPDANPEDIIIAFQKMRKSQFGAFGYTKDMSLVVREAKDIKLIGGIVGIAAKPIAFINGMRTSSRFKAGMQLEDAAMAVSNRIEVKNMASFYANLQNQRRALVERQKLPKGLSAKDTQRLEDIQRKIHITKLDLRKTVAESETPKFVREAGVQDAYVILGAATANQAAEIYGGDPMLWEFLGGMTGVAYSIVRDKNQAAKLLKKFDTDDINEQDLNLANLVLQNMQNFSPEFQESLKTRVKYFNGLRQELISVGVDPELLDTSTTRMFGLALLQTIEEGQALDLHGPAAAAFNGNVEGLTKNLQQQQKLLVGLRTTLEELRLIEGVDVEGNPVNKLFETVEAAITYSDGTTAQLRSDLEVLGRSYEKSIQGLILGGDEKFSHLDEGSKTELGEAFESLSKHNISRVDNSSIVAIRDEATRTSDLLATTIAEKSNQIARKLPTQNEVNAKVGGTIEKGTIFKPSRDEARPSDIQTAGDALAALTENANVREKNLAAAPFRQLDNSIFYTVDGKMVSKQGASTDAGPVVDAMFELLGKEEGVMILRQMGGTTLSSTNTNRMFEFLNTAAGSFLDDTAQRLGRNVDELRDEALASAGASRDKGIPIDLFVAQQIRKDAAAEGVELGVLPINYQQVRELSTALKEIEFKAPDSAKLAYAKLAVVSDNLMDTFEVQTESGMRVPVGQLFIKQEDGKLKSTQAVLAEGNELWSDYKTRFYNDENLGKWLGWRDRNARLPRNISPDNPLGIDYGANKPTSWLDFESISNMKDAQKKKITSSLSESLGVLQPNGTRRIDLRTADGQAIKTTLEAHAREWMQETVLSGKNIDFNEFRRKANSLQDTFVGVDADGNKTRILNIDNVMRDVFPDFGPDTIDKKYYDAGVEQLNTFASGEVARVKKEADKIIKGFDETTKYLQGNSRTKLDSKNVASTLISGGIGRINDVKAHLKKAGRNDEEVNSILASLLTQEINRKAFKPTGVHQLDPSDSNVLIPELDLDQEGLKNFMGFNDPTTREAVISIIGERTYKTYENIINFTANQTVGASANINLTGIPRKFSVESYISRFYAVNRGVVSFRYVGTEAILQQMRRRNMSVLTAALTSPKVGTLIAEMIETGKPLPANKERQLFEMLVVAVERFDNINSAVSSGDKSVSIVSDFGHSFEYTQIRQKLIAEQ